MKKVMVVLLSLGLVFGIGITVIANTSDGGFTSFEEMMPFMQDMHPNWSEEDLESMYNSCHGSNGNRGLGPSNNMGPSSNGHMGPGQCGNYQSEPGSG